MASLEREILTEAREVTGVKKLRQKDIMEWSTGALEQVQPNEKQYFLPVLKINIAVLKAAVENVT